MSAYSDKRLVSEALEDSHQAFEQLVKQYQYRVLRTIASIISDEQAAQDVAQETFLLAWRDLPKLKEKQKFGRWLNQIAISSSKLWLRDQRRYQRNTVSLEEGAVARAQELRHQREKLRQAVWDAIDVLAAEHREVIILHYISGYSYKEISQMLSVPVSTVQGRLQKARNQLRKEFMDMVRKLQLEIDSALHNFLRQHAEQDGTSVESLIVRLIEKYKRDIDAGVSGTQIAGPTYRVVLDDEIAGMRIGERDFSPTGDRIVFASQGKLYIADQSGTVIRPLLDDFGPWEKLAWPQWSRDGRLIAYRASREEMSESGTREGIHAIFVLSPDDGEPRQFGPELKGSPKPHWTPDGQHLAYLAPGGGVYIFALDGSEVAFITKEDMAGWRLVRSSCSPDGRWLACAAPKESRADRHETEIWILPATGGQAQRPTHLPEDSFVTPAPDGLPLYFEFGQVQRLTHLPEFNSFVTWAPDGRTLYCLSETADTQNIWKLPMDRETGLQKGGPQQVTFFNDAEISNLKVLGDGDQIAFEMQRTITSIQIADASWPDEAGALVRGHSPQLSPDGQTVYYVDDTPGEEGIYAMPREGGTPQRLTESRPVAIVRSHNPWHLPVFDLSPDGRTLAYVTKLGEEEGLFTLPVSGDLEPQLLAKITNARWGVVPQWSPDGSQLAYAAGGGLYVIPAAGGQARELAHLHNMYNTWGYAWEEWTVRWSPDGKFIAALAYPKRESENAAFVVPAVGGELQQLTPDVEYKEGLEWHPDGQRLTYHVSRYDSETRQAYLDGRPASLLFDAPDDIWDYVGNWTPDGRRFFFMGSVSGKGCGIYVYDEGSGDITLVSPYVPDAGVPRFSRDGTTMAWWATRNTARQTWVMENFLAQSPPAK